MENTDRPDDVTSDETPDDTVRLDKEPPGTGYDPPPDPPPCTPPPPGSPWPGLGSLYRTREPRIIAGVCGGLARATGTDPILFRVILAVLSIFGGLGVAIYLVAWLLLPLDGESASPLESLLGRGRSSTGPVLTIVLAVIAVIAVGNAVGEFGNVVLGAAVIVGLALLLHRSGAIPGRGAFVGGPPPAYAGPPDPGMGATATQAPPESGYTPPFAPHGPWGGPPWRRHHGGPPPVPPLPRPPRRPRRPRSKLGRLTLSVICLALAALGAIDLGGASVPKVTYWGTALAVTAGGLLVGTWFGRARGLILLGIVLTLGTSAAGVAHHVSADDWGKRVTWTPATAAAVERQYQGGTGDATLDLSAIDFTGETVETQVNVGAGHLVVKLPPKVDVDIRANLGMGNAEILGQKSDGFGIARDVTDHGPDGTGGGALTLKLDVGAGQLEVVR